MSLDDEGARLHHHLASAGGLVAEARALGIDGANAVERAAKRLSAAWDAVERGEDELVAFTVRTAGITYRSMDHERRSLEATAVDARLAMREAFRNLERVGEPVARAVVHRRTASESAPLFRRGPGRPGWNAATFHPAYREARDRAGGLAALDKEIAAAWPMSLKQLQKLVRRYGRPA